MNIFEASIPLSAGIKVAECLDSAATFGEYPKVCVNLQTDVR